MFLVQQRSSKVDCTLTYIPTHAVYLLLAKMIPLVFGHSTYLKSNQSPDLPEGQSHSYMGARITYQTKILLPITHQLGSIDNILTNLERPGFLKTKNNV